MPQTPTVAIIVSRYNESVTRHLREGAVRAYEASGGDERDLAIIEAAGAFEIPILVQEATLVGMFQGVVALGCIVKGETDHDRHLAGAVTTALMDIAIDSGIPVGLGVLTVNSIEQAVARSGGSDGREPGNKGEEAMRAVLATIGGILALAESPNAPKQRGGVRFALDGASPDKGAPTRAGARRRAPSKKS